jgi:hypothetical protein
MTGCLEHSRAREERNLRYPGGIAPPAGWGLQVPIGLT